MKNSIYNKKEYAFSLVETLITLLIICLITLASIPVLTKKHRGDSILSRHGAFVCYWDGDNLISRYKMGSKVSVGKTITDANELDERIDYGEYGPVSVSQPRKGCVFNPPAGIKSYTVTVIGGGGGGAGAYAKDFMHSFFQNESGSLAANKVEDGDDSIDYKNDNLEDPDNLGDPDDDDDLGEAEDVHVVTPSGTGVIFTAPVTTQYEFLVAGGGGGGGDVYGGCHDDGAYSKSWPCAGTGTPGAVLVTNPTQFSKGTTFNITPGPYGASGGHGVHGQPGGDSILKISAGLKDYLVLAQGGGGGFSPNYEDRNYCYYYDNVYCSPTSSKACYTEYKGSGATYVSLHSREAKKHRCKNSGTAKDLGKSGSSGGYINRGFTLKHANVQSDTLNWYEYEKLGAYLFTVDDDGKWVKGEVAKRYDHSLHRPYRNNIMTKSLMDRFGISQYEDQLHPFAAGGAGGLSSGPASRETKRTTSGGRGVVAVRYHRAFAGLGGKAGKVLQMPYSELPPNTLVFPGRGGKGGGVYIKTVLGSHPSYELISLPATSGQSSYMKNGLVALGGSGAVTIDPDYPSTYYVTSYDNSNIGQNGEMANVLPVKKSAGGAGGKTSVAQNSYINNTNSFQGLTRTDIFKGGNIVGFFKEIIAAGAGGGGGAAATAFSSYQPNSKDYMQQSKYVNTNFGRGGDGSSGLVLIQW